MAMRDAGPQPLPFGCASITAGHVCGRPGLVDENEALGIEIRLTVEPGLPLRQDVRAILLSRVRGLFFQVIPWRSKKRHSVPMPKRCPCSASFA